MIVKSKYKVCKRLGSGVYGKCQTQKFALSEAKAKKTSGKRRFRPRSDYGQQLIEKQKVRFTYGVQEKQFYNYVKKSIADQKTVSAEKLHQLLETRLDNVVFRAGLADSRRAARQMVSHGHIVVDGRKNNIPSLTVKSGQVISVRPQSVDKGMFTDMDKKLKNHTPVPWLTVDAKKLEIKVNGQPAEIDPSLDFNAVIEFYSR